jgi:hypothetical protein
VRIPPVRIPGTENLTTRPGALDGEQMSEALSLAIAPERMTWDEICRRFPNEWVVLVGTDWRDDHNFEFGNAHVFAHRESRSEATKDMGMACRSFENVGCFFTGRVRGPIPRFIVP